MVSLGMISGSVWTASRGALSGEPPLTRRRWSLRTRGCERRLRFIEDRCASALAWLAYMYRAGLILGSRAGAEPYASASPRRVVARPARAEPPPTRSAPAGAAGVGRTSVERAARVERSAEPCPVAAAPSAVAPSSAGSDDALSRDSLLAALAHELRSPLGVTLNWAQLLLSEDHRLDDKLRRGLSAIERSARLQQRLVDDVLDAARIGFGVMRVERTTLDLSRQCTLAISTFEPKARAAGVALSAMIETWLFVDGDEVRVQQLLHNLLDNALKFTPAGGHVSLTLMRTGNDVELVVADDGRGIAAELLPRIFECYTQGRRDGARSSGLGLGLAIAQRISELHDGTLTAQSAGVGCGATFTWRLPAVSAPEAAGPTHSP